MESLTQVKEPKYLYGKATPNKWNVMEFGKFGSNS